MIKKVAYSAFIVFSILTLAGFIIAYGRGYRLNFEQKSLSPTGILSANSFPSGASLFLNGKLTSATNTTLSLSPGWYKVRLSKEGYLPWEKEVRIQGEIVTKIEALLIPSNPSLKAITTTGVLAPVLSPNESKIAYLVEDEEGTTGGHLKPKSGVWILELKDTPLGGRIPPKQIYASFGKIASSEIVWSPDEKKILLLKKQVLKEKKTSVSSVLQISLEEEKTPQDVTSTYEEILSEWEKEKREKESLLLANLPPRLSSFFKSSTSFFLFSPDESKILYLASASAELQPFLTPIIGANSTPEQRKIEPEKYYLYDTKEDKNFLLFEKKDFPDPSLLKWYSDSKHILMIEKDTIYIMDYDGTNKRPVYTGPFEKNLLFPWSSPGKIVILTSFNKPKGALNFYEIDLR